MPRTPRNHLCRSRAGPDANVPEFLRDNPFVLGAHRPQLDWRRACASLFRLHNQTVNVWSHLLGFLWQAGFTAWFMVVAAPSPRPKWPLAAYQACDMLTLLASSAAHLLCCVGPRASAALWRLDHAGIVLGLTGEAVPFCVYAFACRPGVRAAYLGASVGLGGGLLALSGTEWFQSPARRAARPAAMGLLVALRVASTAHAMTVLLLPPAARQALGLCWASMAAFALGAAVFVARVPERLAPGRFDLVGNSHNIMHALTLAGMLMATRSGWLLWRFGGDGEPACATGR